MKCLDDCHSYLLDNFIDGDRPEALVFYRMAADGTKKPGTTNEEVIRALIHRLKFLNEEWMSGKFKCIENTMAIGYLESALMWLRRRTEDRKARNVEGTQEV